MGQMRDNSKGEPGVATTIEGHTFQKRLGPHGDDLALATGVPKLGNSSELLISGA